jgi:hypothetical protein
MESCLFYRHVSDMHLIVHVSDMHLIVHVSDMHLIVHVSNGYSSLNLCKESHLSHNTEDWMQQNRKCSTADT